MQNNIYNHAKFFISITIYIKSFNLILALFKFSFNLLITPKCLILDWKWQTNTL